MDICSFVYEKNRNDTKSMQSKKIGIINLTSLLQVDVQVLRNDKRKNGITVSGSCSIYQYTSTCTLLPRNQRFYRQITSQEKDGSVSGVGQW